MKNKLLIIGVILMVLDNYIERLIFKTKNNYYKNIIEKQEVLKVQENPLNKQNDLKQKKLEADILENRYHLIMLNKGSHQGVKVNQIVVGEAGFIGVVTHVEESICEVKTFWHTNNNLVVVNGDNAYGYLHSNGYYITIKNNDKSNSFQHGDKIYLHLKEGIILLGVFVVKKYKQYIIPIENITKINKVYIIKS